MSSFIQKIRKASVSRSTFHFNPCHLQSAEFMQNNVVYSRFVVPTDHFKIKPVFEGRCAALTNPSFIDTEYHVRGFYVPHSIVWKRFDDFVNGNATLERGQHIFTNPPYVTDKGLTELLITYSTVYQDASFNPSTTDYKHKCDFIVTPTGGSYTGYVFKNEGRYIYKLLRSLGYKFNFTLDESKSDKMNAFPLLSYMRVYLDYFVPSLFYNISACNILLSKVYDTTSDFDLCSTLVDIKNVFDELYYQYYPSDYLTSSWSQPQSPLGSNLDNIYSQTGSNSEFTDILNSLGTARVNSFDTTQRSDGVQTSGLSAPSNTVANVNAFGNPWVQRNLQKIADWLTRTRFTGTDKLLNILSRFGVKPDNVQSIRSHMVGHFVQKLIVQDINALSDTYQEGATPDLDTGRKLGEYAGKMFSQPQDNRELEFNCDDYGCIIITSMISPADIRYYEGIDRDIMKMKAIDFFQPEFDSMGTELQSRRELISGITFDLPQVNLADWTFQNSNGYVPRYSEYKRDISNISGDFAVNSLNEGMASFHHFRGFSKLGKYKATSSQSVLENALVPNTGEFVDDINTVSLADQPTLLLANSNMLIKAEDKNQYNRIFNATDDNIDHIYTMYYFNIVASRPMKSIADSIDLEDGSNDKVDVSKDVVNNFK